MRKITSFIIVLFILSFFMTEAFAYVVKTKSILYKGKNILTSSYISVDTTGYWVRSAMTDKAGMKGVGRSVTTNNNDLTKALLK